MEYILNYCILSQIFLQELLSNELNNITNELNKIVR